MPVALIALILVILMLAFGFGILGFTFHVLGVLLWYTVTGLVIGGFGRLLIPGRQNLGLGATALLGIVGSILGGVIGRHWLGLGTLGEFLTAVVCAAVLVLIAAGTDRTAGSTS
jgi:uncharacterized membrane protein YeaQ/YmgE (transglycosylase-associated protein family)